MPPRPFYDVEPALYLFGKNEEKPEEGVRQWVLFELLSTYGELVRNIRIEWPVRVGTRTHFADIVVLRNHVPHVVIECKRWEDEKVDRCISQAISYASADEIRAEFAVCTNGRKWLVKRKVENEWVPVPDISTSRDLYLGIELDSLLDFVHSFRPLLYWLHRAVPEDRAQEYLGNLQRFFVCNPWFTDSTNRDLWQATEFLSRNLIHTPAIQDDYTMGNLRAAFEIYVRYLLSIGCKPSVVEPSSWYSMRELIGCLSDDFGKLARHSTGIEHKDTGFLRFIASFLRYVRQVHNAGRYLAIPATLVGDFNSLVNIVCNTRLKVRFPDVLEDISDLTALCVDEWKSVVP